MSEDLRLIFCGDRNYKDSSLIRVAVMVLKEKFSTFTMIEGEADGADTLSRREAELSSIPYKSFFAHWDHHYEHTEKCEPNAFTTCRRPLCIKGQCGKMIGRAAGPIRNHEMLDEGKPHGVVAFHEDIMSSRGTAHMVGIARKVSIPTWISQEGAEAFLEFVKDLQDVLKTK